MIRDERKMGGAYGKQRIGLSPSVLAQGILITDEMRLRMPYSEASLRLNGPSSVGAITEHCSDL
jgi:hypothetical protein